MRHELHLGDEGDGPAPGLADRLGDRRRRRRRHGDPRLHRRGLHVPALRLDAAAANPLDVSIVAAVWIVVMTWICYIGIELSARTQYFLLGAEIVALALFAVVALVKVYTAPGPARSMSPLTGSTRSRSRRYRARRRRPARRLHLLGLGHRRRASTRNPRHPNGPGRAAVISTILLVLIYVVVDRRPGLRRHSSSPTMPTTCSAPSATNVFGSPLDKLLIIAVLTSAAASTQTTILPTARTTLSMARFEVDPEGVRARSIRAT